MIKLHTAADGQFYFTVCGKNGEVILTSETYPTKSNRNRAVKKFQAKLIKQMATVEITTVNKKTLKDVVFARELDKRS